MTKTSHNAGCDAALPEATLVASQPPSFLPRIAIEVDECDGCCKGFTIDRLSRVVGMGLMCWPCIELLRDEGAA